MKTRVLGKRGRPSTKWDGDTAGDTDKGKRQALTKQVAVVAQRVDWVPPSVALSMRDKAVQLRLDDDQLVCSGAEVRGRAGLKGGP